MQPFIFMNFGGQKPEAKVSLQGHLANGSNWNLDHYRDQHLESFTNQHLFNQPKWLHLRPKVVTPISQASYVGRPTKHQLIVRNGWVQNWPLSLSDKWVKRICTAVYTYIWMLWLISNLATICRQLLFHLPMQKFHW